jgi:ATP-dependent Clp protease adaptor protein ClpS
MLNGLQEISEAWPRRVTSQVPTQPSRPQVAPEVDVAEAEEERLDDPWRVILFDDDVHTFDEVILQLIKATGCDTARAEQLAWQVHTEGKAAVYEGVFEECFRVQAVLREIQLVTEIEG